MIEIEVAIQHGARAKALRKALAKLGVRYFLYISCIMEEKLTELDRKMP